MGMDGRAWGLFTYQVQILGFCPGPTESQSRSGSQEEPVWELTQNVRRRSQKSRVFVSRLSIQFSQQVSGKLPLEGQRKVWGEGSRAAGAGPRTSNGPALELRWRCTRSLPEIAVITAIIIIIICSSHLGHPRKSAHRSAPNLLILKDGTSTLATDSVPLKGIYFVST